MAVATYAKIHLVQDPRTVSLSLVLTIPELIWIDHFIELLSNGTIKLGIDYVRLSPQ